MGIENSKVSIIILVRNALLYFKKCFESIINHTTNYELIVIDSGSNKETKKYLNSIKNKCTILTNPKNVCIAYGIDQGIKISKYDFICSLNSDCIVTNNWLTRLLEGFNYPDAGITGPSTSYCGGLQCLKEYQNKRFKMSLAEIDAINLEPGVIEKFDVDDIRTGDVMPGFCYLISKAVINKIGVFDWKRYGYNCGEDCDFVWRARRAGFKTYWCKGSYVHHYGNITTKEMRIDPVKLRERARSIFYERIKDEVNLFIENDVSIPR